MDNIRYIVLNGQGEIVVLHPWGTRFQYDFTLPGQVQGGRVIDLHVLSPEQHNYWTKRMEAFNEA